LNVEIKEPIAIGCAN